MRHLICRVRIRILAIVASYTLHIEFDDITQQIFDFEPVLKGELYGPLLDLASLTRFRSLPTPERWYGRTAPISTPQ